jgi:hypothetical protein
VEREDKHANMPIKDNQGNLLTSEREQDERWKRHFAEFLICPEPYDLADIPESEVLSGLSL